MRSTATTVALSLLLLASACAGPKAAGVPPRERYIQAVEHRMNGDSRAWFDGLIALANDAPDSRAGRRARATLQGESLSTTVAVAGVLAAVAVPSFIKYRNRARAAEAAVTLRTLHMAQQMFRIRNGRFCKRPAECGFEPIEDAHYVYLLTPETVAGGQEADDPEGLVRRGTAALARFGLAPRMGEEGFLFAAFGDLDDDPTVDVWTIDEGGEAFHVVDDLEEPGESFGL